MEQIICGTETLKGKPCSNVVAWGSRKCAAGHKIPGSRWSSLDTTDMPTEVKNVINVGSAKNEGTIDFEEVGTSGSDEAIGKNNPFGSGYTINLNNLNDAIQDWDASHSPTLEEPTFGPRQWGEFADDGYYTADFINHLSAFDVWVSLGDAPKTSFEANFDEFQKRDRGQEVITLSLSSPNPTDIPTARVVSPPVYVTGLPDWPSDGLTLKDDLGIDSNTDLAQALLNLSKFQTKMLRSVPFLTE